MRITAGNMRGRVMQVPGIEGLRPTSSRVREALFNMLGDMHGRSMLDLFSGSGVMALEALSRGAAAVQSIESNHQACVAMRKLEQAWQVKDWTITAGSLPQAFSPKPSHVDIIYADPPYQQGIAVQLASWLKDAHISYDVLVIEEASRAKIAWSVPPYQQRKYGESTLYFFDGRGAKT